MGGSGGADGFMSGLRRMLRAAAAVLLFACLGCGKEAEDRAATPRWPSGPIVSLDADRDGNIDLQDGALFDAVAAGAR